ncbi:DUF2235 domain-containing protein [Morganella psychrotolerans]|uniref:T6SS phospholipase effector Tle1-like catalytic domain-containing protein n=1 Tax=Morganella psychrotolerans TaxID=368603 RepID=UPI0031D34542
MLTQEQLIENIKKITKEETRHRHDSRRGNKNPCCKSLHVSLFFDGTNNNEPNDTGSTPPHPTNIAKLYHASAPENSKANENGFYAYYIPGVGTPFPQIGTYDYYSAGLQFAVGGEDRINWGLVQLCNTLHHTVSDRFIGNGMMKNAVAMMNSSEPSRLRSRNFAIMAATSPTNFNREKVNQAYLEAVDPENNQHAARLRAIEMLLNPVREKVTNAQCKIVAMKLFVYGFSRGAAEARAFVSWLNDILASGISGFPAGTLLGIKVSVEFLGLFDTVPAVGIANVIPGFTGHNGWAGQTQPLPESGLIKKCCHFVASHEQRQSFSLDSVRTAEGHYLPGTLEVVYPGMHSDVGGGYPAGDQGKSRDDAGDLLSQITLHDMYAAAIEAGAPLSVHPEFFRKLHLDHQQRYSFREMNAVTLKEFGFSSRLVSTFNNWQLTTAIMDNQQESDTPLYSPFRYESACLEQVMEDQLTWMTGWRIARFSSPESSDMHISAQPFFKHAPQNPAIQAQPYEPEYGRQAQRALSEEWSLLACQAKLTEKARKAEMDKHSEDKDWFPAGDLIGAPLFDANNARGQLWEAASEFAADYERRQRPEPLLFKPEPRKRTQPVDPVTCTVNVNTDSNFPGSISRLALILQIIDPLLSRTAYFYTYQNEAFEYLKFKDKGRLTFEQYFEPYLNPEITPGFPKRIKDTNTALLINLFDNYIHDSRAWFMHSESGVREPFGGYFLSRMIYFGNKWNKAVQLHFDGSVLGVEQRLQDMAVFAHHPTYGVKVYHRMTGQEIPVDESQLPASTHEFITQLKPLVAQRKQDRVTEIYANLRAIVDGTHFVA